LPNILAFHRETTASDAEEMSEVAERRSRSHVDRTERSIEHELDVRLRMIVAENGEGIIARALRKDRA
jgi:hypothetical protein